MFNIGVPPGGSHRRLRHGHSRLACTFLAAGDFGTRGRNTEDSELEKGSESRKGVTAVTVPYASHITRESREDS